MTPRERVRRAQRRLVGTIVLAAVLWGAVLGMGAVTVAALADHLVRLPAMVRAAVLPLAALALLGGAGAVFWRGRAARSLERVALWLEEREPSLHYALVTAIDPALPPSEAQSGLHAAAGRVDIEGIVRGAWRRTLARALIGVVVLAVLLLLLHPGDLLRTSSQELVHRAGAGPPAPMANRLAALSARVVPPAYSRLPAQTIDEPSSIAALAGARIALDGRGLPDGLTAVLDSARLDAGPGERGWALGFAMPLNPAVVVLRDRDYRRLLSLEPRPDSAPDVRLRVPLHDTTWQTVPKGRLDIEAALSDDIGLDYGYVEYLVSTGAEENFDTRLVEGPRVAFGNARSATLRAAIDLDTMKLSPGSVLHIRVLGFDFNDVTGPGRGVSETRTLRVAEPLDSTSINAAPPQPIDSMWISQRLLNMRTDTLVRTRRHLTREQLVHTSSGYSNTQEDIRQRALAVISILEDNGVGGTSETETSKKLREAADLMWTAREDLGLALPDTALPIMKRILKILDDVRLANRYFLRGVLKPVPVDIARIRLTGKDPAAVAVRTPRAELREATLALARRLDAVAALAHAAPAAAADSLVYLRVVALTTAPQVAAPLQRAIDLLRHGAPVDSALAQALRALEPPARIWVGHAEWSAVLP